jgi:hypothetical protein
MQRSFDGPSLKLALLAALHVNEAREPRPAVGPAPEPARK